MVFAGFLLFVFWKFSRSTPGQTPARLPIRLPKGLISTSVLIGVNWYLYIYSVSTHQVLESSFGYFINPLMNVALGWFFLRERLTRLQLVALLAAVLGVLLMGLHLGRIPWLGLALAATFALYGLLRKRNRAGTIEALFYESLLLAPIAIAFLLMHRGGHQQLEASTSMLLVGSGVVTALPLLAFGTAVKSLPLATIGFMQYLAPTLQFLIAVFVLDEPFDSGRLAGFALIWVGLALYSFSMTSQLPRRH